MVPIEAPIAVRVSGPDLAAIGEIAGEVERILLANPIAAVLTQMRHSILDSDAPTAAAAIGGAPRLLIPAAIVVIVFAVGLWVFNREAPRIAENL